MRIALCQFSAGQDKSDNLDRIRHWIEAAAGEQADFIAFPEYAMFMPQPGEAGLLGEHAESLDGEFVSSLSRYAKENSIAVLCNVFERRENELPFNTSVVLDRRGDLLGRYRKAHLYDAFGYRESADLTAPTSPKPLVVSIEGFEVGVLICYDLRFPEWARLYVDQGADVLIYSAGWPPGPRKDDHWNVMLRSRAIENTCYVAGVVQGPPLATGGTLLIDPMGGVEGELTDEDGLILRNISLDRVSHVRTLNPSLKNRVIFGS